LNKINNNQNKPERIVFTDLDGTLLDPSTYSFEAARPAIQHLQLLNIPLILCSSKTCKEQEMYIRELNISHPFIVENGSAIYIPVNYFPFSFDCQRKTDKYLVIELGTSYKKVVDIINAVRKEMDIDARGYADMSIEEVATETGLSLQQATLAKEREYSESLNIAANQKEISEFLAKIESAGLRHIRGGRFWSIQGDSDKGKATLLLLNMLKKKLGNISSAGIGDSRNDIDMLCKVDIPYQVRKPDNTWEQISIPGLHRMKGIGPAGWVEAVMDFTADL